MTTLFKIDMFKKDVSFFDMSKRHIIFRHLFFGLKNQPQKFKKKTQNTLKSNITHFLTALLKVIDKLVAFHCEEPPLYKSREASRQLRPRQRLQNELVVSVVRGSSYSLQDLTFPSGFVSY